jgi:hypothetical protein
MEKPKFIPKIPSFLKCSICFGIFVKPSRITCGHTFCLHCINDWIKKQTKATCPICREPAVNPSNDLIALHVISQWKVNCTNKGCFWTGKYEDYENHKHVLITESHTNNFSTAEIDEIFKKVDDLILRKEPFDGFIGEQIEKGMSSNIINKLILAYQEKSCTKRKIKSSPVSSKKKK